MRVEELTIGKGGAQLFRAALTMIQLGDLESALAAQPRDHAGVRLSGIPELGPFLGPVGPVGRIPASVLGPECLPVRAILFDKSAGQNWSLGWHQDRTIAVKQRVDVNGFGPWSIKSGMVHVEPPFDLLARMLTLRVHLDPVPVTNAPLLVAPGSHRRGRIPTPEIPNVVHQCGVIPCLAELGTYGFIRRLFFMPQMRPSSRYTVEYCRSIMLWAAFPAGCNGWASEHRSNERQPGEETWNLKAIEEVSPYRSIPACIGWILPSSSEGTIAMLCSSPRASGIAIRTSGRSA